MTDSISENLTDSDLESTIDAYKFFRNDGIFINHGLFFR